MTHDEARLEIIAHTVWGSRHQLAALEVLKGYQARGYMAEYVKVKCSMCHKTNWCVRWSDNGTTIDTWGYVEQPTIDNSGHVEHPYICHLCLGEGYIGDILMTPPKKIKMHEKITPRKKSTHLRAHQRRHRGKQL